MTFAARRLETRMVEKVWGRQAGKTWQPEPACCWRCFLPENRGLVPEACALANGFLRHCLMKWNSVRLGSTS